MKKIISPVRNVVFENMRYDGLFIELLLYILCWGAALMARLGSVKSFGPLGEKVAARQQSSLDEHARI